MLTDVSTVENLLREVWHHPDRRVHLDWYDGPVQSLLAREDHGPWYLFAVRFGAGTERLYAALPLDDTTILDSLGDVETREDADWLVRLGTDVLLPATAGPGWWMTVRDGDIAEVRAMDDAERARVQPRALHDLLRG